MNENLTKEERELLPLVSFYDDGIRYGRLLTIDKNGYYIVVHPNGTKTKVQQSNITNITGPYMDVNGVELSQRSKKKMGN